MAWITRDAEPNCCSPRSSPARTAATRISELEPRLFSFNNPAGACPACDGLGVRQFFDPERVVGHPELSLAGGAVRGWDRRNAYYFQLISVTGGTLRLRHRNALRGTAGADSGHHPARQQGEEISFRYLNERRGIL